MICSTGRRGVGGVGHSSCEPPGRPRRRAAVPRRGRGARGVAPGAGHLARAGRSCSPPADGTKASASSGLHTSSAPSTPHVFAPTLAALVAMMLTTHERMPVLLGLHSVVRCLVGVRGPPLSTDPSRAASMRAIVGVLVALAAAAGPSLAFYPAHGSFVATPHRGFSDAVSRRSFGAGLAACGPACPLLPAAARRSPAVLDLLMQERGRGRGARGSRGGRGGSRGGGAGRARAPAGRGGGWGWEDSADAAGSRPPDFKRMRRESNREAVWASRCCFSHGGAQLWLAPHRMPPA